jgi:hypothetical protein
MILTLSYTLFYRWPARKGLLAKSTGGRAPQHQLAPHEPRPEPTMEERLRVELAQVRKEIRSNSAWSKSRMKGVKRRWRYRG